MIYGIKIDEVVNLRKLYSMLLLSMCLICGCSSNVEIQDELVLNEKDLVYIEELSPNEQYIENIEDKVFYIVKVYQLENNDVVVCVYSNSAFFDGVEYQIPCDDVISESDINVVWTTMMGNTEDAEDDQYAFVNISISNNGYIFSERKVNLTKGAMEIVIEVIEQSN